MVRTSPNRVYLTPRLWHSTKIPLQGTSDKLETLSAIGRKGSEWNIICNKLALMKDRRRKVKKQKEEIPCFN
jgi:hypothetical protein